MTGRKNTAWMGASFVVLALALSLSSHANAQSASESDMKSADTDQESAPIEPVELIVTGSRIVRNGFTAPTPTTVFSQEDIRATALPNIADVANQLPQLQGSATPSTGNGGTSQGASGQNILNLRGLGGQRALVLIDGRRVVPTVASGVTDANNIPGQAVTRIDVVTGGASAAYGSDAVAGVVNFVLDKEFTGLKGEMNGGISSRNDNASRGLALTYGGRFLNNRLHVLLSGEWQKTDGIDHLDTSKRSWYTGTRLLPNSAFVSRTATPNVPALLTFNNVNHSLAAPGGLITSGPLKGTQFGVGGQLLPFSYGSYIAGSLMAGGQFEDSGTESQLVSQVDFANFLGRADYEINDRISLFAQFLYGYSRGRGKGANQRKFGTLTIQKTNAYLPQSIVDAMTLNNVTSFGFGTNVEDIGGAQQDNKRRSKQATIGLNGSLGNNWKWDVYYQFGRSDLDIKLNNVINKSNYTRAIDAVFASNGGIVCRNVATFPNCVPLNPFGVGVASPQALAYITGTAATRMQLTQQVAEASLSGDIADLWAGPISATVGAGWRKEDVATSYVDNVSLASGWFAGNYKPTNGSYNVKELFGEAVVPLAKDFVLAHSLELNAAVRRTDYSSSGIVTTWKVGVNYRPIPDVLIRATRSRDIRAPGLNDLYSGGSVNTAPILDPRYSNASVSIPNSNVGNPNLKPEGASSWGVGAVYQPSWLRGFSASVDYYNIKVRDAIASPGTQNIVNLCEAGVRPDYCALVTRGTGVVGGVLRNDAIVSTITGPVNLASLELKGYDIELGYRKNLADWVPGWDANLSLRALGTRVLKNVTDDGVGSRHDAAGENRGSTPRWRWNVSALYNQNRVTLSATWRLISSGVLSTSFYDNAAGPLTVDNNYVAGASYVDAGINYKIPTRGGLEVYFRVSNLFDKSPPIVASQNFLAPSFNPSLFDVVGRYFRAGVRFKI